MISHSVKRPASLASCMLATLSMASIASAQSGPMPSAMPIGELKRRAFGNDFRLLKAWSDSQLRPVSVSHATVATA